MEHGDHRHLYPRRRSLGSSYRHREHFERQDVTNIGQRSEASNVDPPAALPPTLRRPCSRKILSPAGQSLRKATPAQGETSGVLYEVQE